MGAFVKTHMDKCVFALVVGFIVAFSSGCIATVQARPAPPARPVTLKLDHGLICASRLGPLGRAFASVGLRPDYRGRHNIPTVMDQLGFEDGTYIGIEAPIKPPAPPNLSVAKLMDGNAGPCGWAVTTSHIKAELERVSRLGVPVGRPEYLNRKIPGGRLIKWWEGRLGNGRPGATLPFLMQDITPHKYRTLVSASTKGTGVTGLAVVVLGVKNLDASIALFRHVYHWPPPKVEIHTGFGAKLAYFAHTPVILAAPLTHSWLSDRLRRFGNCPVAFLLGSSDFKATMAHFSLHDGTPWFNRQVSWFNAKKLHGVRLGIIGQ